MAIPPLEQLAQIGVTGLVLYWLLTQVAPRLDKITSALERQNRAILMLLIAFPDVPSSVKEQARLEMQQIDRLTRGQNGQ